MAAARDGRAEAVTLNGDGVAVAANEFLYRKSIVIVPILIDASNDFHARRLRHAWRRCAARSPEIPR